MNKEIQIQFHLYFQVRCLILLILFPFHLFSICFNYFRLLQKKMDPQHSPCNLATSFTYFVFTQIHPIKILKMSSNIELFKAKHA